MWWHYQNKHIEINKKFWKKFRKISFFVFIILVIIVVLLFLDVKRQTKKSNSPSDNLDGDSISYAVPKQTFSNDYFSFTVGVEWQEQSEPEQGRYYYKYMSGDITMHILTVYVNRIEPIDYATRVLPIDINSDKSIKRGQVSEHCANFTGVKPITKAEPQRVRVSGIDMFCASDSTRYIVLFGKNGGSTTINGQENNLLAKSIIIEYKNVTAFPEPSKLYEIAETLKFK